ncbi:hypothetical protein GCM10009104_04040 [Marinobacterium maritimum]|uniref:Lipoprotein n=1 Tax=Marinobacterium maritimum TaxID=500162 RepID=A0ABN1I1Z0_9GAMM
MFRWLTLSLAVASTLGCVATAPLQPEEQSVACDEAWYGSVEQRLGTGDGQGHGPDLGSAEWKSVVEFRLGVRDDLSVPDPASAEWCGYIEQRLQQRQASQGALIQL